MYFYKKIQKHSMEDILTINEIIHEEDSTQEILKNWWEDIEDIFPHFNEEEAEFSRLLLLKYRNKNVGIFIFQKKGEELHVHVDYVIPEFRNIGIGKTFFKQKINEFKSNGFSTIISLTDKKMHINYLKSLGFHLSKFHPHRFELNLKKY